MKCWILAVAMLPLLNIGCTSLALERQTINQIQTISDIRYQEVMNDLALMATNPDTLPSYAVVADGNMTMNRIASIDAKTFWARAMFKGFSQETINPGATTNPIPQWTLNPVADHDRLNALRAAFRVLLCGWPQPGSDDALLLHLFQIDHDLAKLPRGWFHLGKLTDIPQGACYKAHHHNTAAWVMPDGMAGLSNFTLIALDIGTVDLTSLQLPPVVADVKVTKKYGEAAKDKPDMVLEDTTVKVLGDVGHYTINVKCPEGGNIQGLPLPQVYLDRVAPKPDETTLTVPEAVLPDGVPNSQPRFYMRQKATSAQLRSQIGAIGR